MVEKINGSNHGLTEKGQGFWSYLRQKELDFFPSGALRWWLVAIITIAWATEQFERSRLSPVLVYFLKDFNITLKFFGVMNLLAIIASSVGAYALGTIADRYGRRHAIVWPMLIYLVILAGLASAPNIWFYVSLSTIGAFLIMGMSASVNAAIRDVIPRTGRGVAFAFISLAWTLGALMTQGVAAVTIPSWPGWRPQHWIGLIIALFLSAIVYRFYRDISPRIRGQIVADQMGAIKAGLEAHGIKDIEALRDSGSIIYRKFHIWMIATVLMTWGTTYTTFTAYLPTYLTQWHGVHPAKAAALATWFWLLAGFSVFLSGYISDKTGLRKLTLSVGSLVTGLLVIFGATLPRNTSYQTLVIMWLCVAAIAGFIYPSWCAILSENTEDINPFSVGRAFGLAGALTFITGLILSLVLPQVVARAGWPSWMICAGCFAISNIFFISFAKGPWLRLGVRKSAESSL